MRSVSPILVMRFSPILVIRFSPKLVIFFSLILVILRFSIGCNFAASIQSKCVMECEKQNYKGKDTRNNQIDEKRYLADIYLFCKQLLKKQCKSRLSIVILILLSTFIFSGFSEDNANHNNSDTFYSIISATTEINAMDYMQNTYSNQPSAELPSNGTIKQDIQTAKSQNGTINTTQSLINY